MKPAKIAEDIYRLGVNLGGDYLFEGMWPVPDGVSINTYVVKGDKTAIIDLTQDLDDKPDSIKKQLEKIDVSAETVDYVVVNHMEPDHSGWIRNFSQKNPNVVFYLTAKAAAMMTAFTGLEEKMVIVKSGDTLDLGKGHVLTFYEIPNVHWPETMATFESANGILFSCDAFGSYGSVDSDAVFDDQLSQERLNFYEKEALRYYANIVAAFSPFVEKAIAKLADLDIKIIAPSHGIIWREDAKRIVSAYARYASYMKGPAEPEITIIWGSMYGNTKMMLSSVVQGIRSEKVPVHIFQVPQDDHGFILSAAWKSAGIVLGMPTYEYKMFPPLAHALDELVRKKVQNKKAFRFGSFGWSGGAQKELDEMCCKSKWDFLEPVEWQGRPTEEDLKKGYQRGIELARAVKQKEIN